MILINPYCLLKLAVKECFFLILGSTFSVYDGVLKRKPTVWESVTRLVLPYEQGLEKDLSTSAKYLFPKWKRFSNQGKQYTGSEMLEEVDMLYRGLSSTYFQTCESWGKDENKFRKYVGKVMHILNLSSKILSVQSCN